MSPDEGASKNEAGEMITVKKIVEMCGGEREVQYRLGFVNIYVVQRWYTHSIPPKHWEELQKLAKENKHSLSGDQLWEANKPLVKTQE